MPDSLKSSPFALYAFYQLYKHFYREQAKALTFDIICRDLFPTYPMTISKPREMTSLFITWKKKNSSGDYVLRGCIGTFAKLPLLKGIEKYSLVSALQDTRFPPIAVNELKKLKVSCNILHDFKTIFNDQKGDIFNWDVGVHGIELLFKHPKTSKLCSATFLPEVMPEQGWDKEDTFQNLIEKAGCWEHIDIIMNNYEEYFLEVIRYKGDKSEIGYNEFKNLLDK